MPRPGYKSVYFPDEELWKKIVDEAEKRKVSVYEVLSFATFELQDDGIVAEISQVKDRVRKVIEKLIS